MSRFVFFAISALLITIGFSETSNACSGSRCSYYQWYGGSCGEFTPAGNLIQWMPESYCRKSAGSYYQWYGGSCGEFTPAGNLVQWMNESSCRQECGVIRRR